MAGESQKLKLLNLAKMLYERTDESHGLTCPEIIAGLAEAGIEAERKSVYRDLDALRDFGLDIAKLPTYPVSYALVSRTFTAAELMLLTDAVQSSRFLTVRMAHRLTEGLASLGSCHQAAALSKNVHVEGRIKMQNESVFHHVDTLHEAIRRHRQVAFRYVKHDVNKRPQPQGGGRIYCETPVCLIYSEGCYYLIAYQDEKDPANIRNYRVDRMSYVKVLDRPRRGKEAFAAFDLPSYLRKHFNMFGGPEYRVTLRCTADLEAAMRDRFGQDILFLPEADGYFHFDVPVCVSDQFYGWVCGFGGKVEITSPAEVRQGLHDMVQKLAEQHN